MSTTIQEKLVDKLRSDVAIRSCVEMRVYPGAAPQAADMPYLVYRRTGGATIQALGNPSNTTKAFYEVSIVTETYAEGVALSDLVRTALDGWVDGTLPDSCRLDEEFETPQDVYAGMPESPYRFVQNYILFYA